MALPLVPLGVATVGGYLYGAFSDDDFTWTKAAIISIAAMGTAYLVTRAR